MNARVFIGGRQVDAVAADDRGIAYGDGVFETMRAHRGAVPWWDAHWARLRRGAERLRLGLPEETLVRREAERLLSGESGVLKLLVSRGGGGRGYAPPAKAVPTWLLSRHPLPPSPPREGIVVRWCETRLALQPALAGIKHCNRLEQVLARAEWDAAAACHGGAWEGLMRSAEGDVVGATAANVFVLREGGWATPAIDRCGVSGVCRAWAIAVLDAAQSRLNVTDIETAEAVFLCNAVRGILPVARLAGRTWPLHPQITLLRERLATAHPAFATE